MQMKKGKELSVAVWSAIALGAIGAGVVLAFVAGFFLGHFTGHEKTTTIGTISSSEVAGSSEPATTSPEPATTSPSEGEGEGSGAEPEEANVEPEEAKSEGKAGSESGGGGTSSPSSKSGGKLAVAADPSGELKFTQEQLTTKAGKVEIDFENESPIPHNVAIEANGKVLGETKVIAQGSDSTKLELKPGTYTYFCTVPGHREAGMEGTLTVK